MLARFLRPWKRLSIQSPRGSRAISVPGCLPDSAFQQHFEDNSLNAQNKISGSLLQYFCKHIDQTALAAASAYELTMPLLTASLLGSACWNKLNLQPRQMITQLIRLIEKEVYAGNMTPGCQAWLRGRMILACDSCGMQDYPKGYGLTDLSSLIDDIDRVKFDEEDAAMRCWGYSYLMQSFGRMEACGEYLRRRSSWLESVLTSVHEPTELSGTYTSDQMWSITCAFAASGQAKDREAYDKLMSALAPGAVHGAEALSRNIPVSDFRAWAVSLLSVAATQACFDPTKMCNALLSKIVWNLFIVKVKSTNERQTELYRNKTNYIHTPLFSLLLKNTSTHRCSLFYYLQVGDKHTYTTARECMAMVHDSQHPGDRALAIVNFAFSDFLCDSADELSAQAGDEGWQWSRESVQEGLSALSVH